ncbi:MAG: serine/threonine protein kinase, partial [Alphaproteobacteria bacterium]|nr:serine/threonine protein kinase [Alphaproteobacteria bacterium]
MTKQALETGSTIDGFLIGEKLHVGGMASLWSVTRPDIESPIVMKVPTIMDGEDAEVIVGFEMEMMILPRLSGPHVPRVYAVGDYASQPYIVMEYIDGQSLFHLLEQSPLPPDQVITLATKIAHALRDLHRQNVIHFDLKPSNIMQRANGDITFIDFGLSRHLQLPDLLEEEFHIPMGTGPYISPEQVLQNRSDNRSDLFSLGVILYHLATGQRPFGFPQSTNGLRRRLWRDPIPPRQHQRDIPVWFQEVILRCLEPDPDQRYPTAAQLAFDLQNPSEVKITQRGEKIETDGFFSVLKRRMGFAATMGAPRQPDQSAWLNAPIVVVAIDLSDDSDALQQALRMHAA